MEAVVQSFLAGFPVLMLHSSVTLAMLVVGVLVYTALTPHKDFALVRQGNTAAAISLSGAIVGLALPLAASMAASVSVYDIIIWGLVTLVLQILAFRITDLLLRDMTSLQVADLVAYLSSLKQATESE